MVEFFVLFGLALDVLEELVLVFGFACEDVDLNGDGLVMIQIIALVDFTEPALSEQFESLVLVVDDGPALLSVLAVGFLVSEFQLFFVDVDRVLHGLELLLERSDLLA